MSFKPVSIVVGCAGFIGTNLVAELLNSGKTVVGVDDFSKGSQNNINKFLEHSEFRFIKKDISTRSECTDAFNFAQHFGVVVEVWHLAANSDIPAGIVDSDVDLKDTFLTTSEILRRMKVDGIKKIYFASSSAIYGDLGGRPVHEEIGPLLPISNYGAMKLASEALISAAAEAFLSKACIFRFPNVVGVPATHGVIFDFASRLKQNPKSLNVLGNGSQQKSYLHVSDLVVAMLKITHQKNAAKVDVVNIGPNDNGVSVRWIAEQVVGRMSPSAVVQFGSLDKGWVGDVPRFNYITRKINSYGWSPALGSEQAVNRAINEIAIQMGL
jgi:UDP-glucose 4-epimerase